MPSDASRTAVITGASRGIGKAIGQRLTTEGWRIINLDIIPPDQSDDENPPWIETDLADPASIAAAFEIVAKDGPVTGLVNNAGIALVDKLEDSTVEDFDKTMAINMRAPMLCAQAVMDDMKQAGFGRIVNNNFNSCGGL